MNLDNLNDYAKNRYYPYKGYGASAGVCFAHDKSNANTIEVWVYQDIPKTSEGITTRKLEGCLAKFKPEVVPEILGLLADIKVQVIVTRSANTSRAFTIHVEDGDMSMSEGDETISNEYVTVAFKTDDSGPVYIQMKYGLKNKCDLDRDTW